VDIFHFDENGILLGAGVADPDPLQPGAFLIPAGAVTVAPPAVPEGRRARWNGAAWSLEVVPAPEPEPAPPEPSRADVIVGRLYEIDAATVRPLRAIAAGTAGQFDHDKLAALNAEAAALRAELATLGV